MIFTRKMDTCLQKNARSWTKNMVLLRYWHDPPEKSQMFFSQCSQFSGNLKTPLYILTWQRFLINVSEGNCSYRWDAVMLGAPGPCFACVVLFRCPYWYSKPNPGETTEPHLGKGRMDAAKLSGQDRTTTQGRWKIGTTVSYRMPHIPQTFTSWVHVIWKKCTNTFFMLDLIDHSEIPVVRLFHD